MPFDTAARQKVIFSFGPCEGPAHVNNWIADERERLGTRYYGTNQSQGWWISVFSESLILAQDKRWRNVLGMQVVRTFGLVANG